MTLLIQSQVVDASSQSLKGELAPLGSTACPTPAFEGLGIIFRVHSTQLGAVKLKCGYDLLVLVSYVQKGDVESPNSRDDSN